MLNEAFQSRAEQLDEPTHANEHEHANEKEAAHGLARMYRIRNAASGKLLADPQGSRDNGTTMIQWQDDGGPEQEWLFEPPLRLAR